MRFLVVYCHPVAESYCAALRQATVQALRECGHEVRDRDLYAEGFDPVLRREQRIAYHTRHDNEAGIGSHLDDLRWAEGIAFVYPTWWYGLPAMLKGWLDRVWVPYVTFEIHPDGRPISPRMQQIRCLIGVTTYGSPWWWMKVMHDPGRMTLTRGIGALCHPRCKKIWLGHYLMDRSSSDSRAAFLARVRDRLGRLSVRTG